MVQSCGFLVEGKAKEKTEKNPQNGETVKPGDLDVMISRPWPRASRASRCFLGFQKSGIHTKRWVIKRPDSPIFVRTIF